jgi:hypothetical protein
MIWAGSWRTCGGRGKEGRPYFLKKRSKKRLLGGVLAGAVMGCEKYALITGNLLVWDVTSKFVLNCADLLHFVSDFNVRVGCG